MSRGRSGIADTVLGHGSAKASSSLAGVRVCHFSATTLEGAYFGHIARGVVAAGHEFECGTLGGAPPPAWMENAAPCRYLRLNCTRRSEWPVAAVRLARHLRARRIDVLQTHLVHGA